MSSTWKEIKAGKVAYPAIYTGPQTTNPVNATLGFQKIYALNLPHRLDKSDELALAAQASGMKIDLIKTKLTKDLNEAGLPYHRKFDDGPGTIGVWRAHADAWRKIIDDGVTTALIFEDDNDWDVDVKQQLQRLHQPLATLINSVENDGKVRKSTADDPYLHEDWDVLMLGYCMELPYSDEQQLGPKGVDPNVPPHILYDDLETIAPRNNTSDSIKEYMDHYGYPIPGGEEIPNPRATFSRPRRLIAKAHFPICLSAYAVSQRGAARLLYHQTRSVMDAIDITFAVMMQEGLIKGYEVMPPIMDQWKVKDGKFKNSDNDLTSQGDVYVADGNSTLNHNPSIGFTWHVVNSVRENLPKLLAYP